MEVAVAPISEHTSPPHRKPELQSTSVEAQEASSSLVFCDLSQKRHSQRFLQTLCVVCWAHLLSNQTLAFMWVRSFPHLLTLPLPKKHPQLLFGKCPLQFCYYQDVERRPSLKSQVPPLPFGKEEVPEIHASYACWLFVDGSLFRQYVFIDKSSNAA